MFHEFTETNPTNSRKWLIRRGGFLTLPLIFFFPIKRKSSLKVSHLLSSALAYASFLYASTLFCLAHAPRTLSAPLPVTLSLSPFLASRSLSLTLFLYISLFLIYFFLSLFPSFPFSLCKKHLALTAYGLSLLLLSSIYFFYFF